MKTTKNAFTSVGLHDIVQPVVEVSAWNKSNAASAFTVNDMIDGKNSIVYTSTARYLSSQFYASTVEVGTPGDFDWVVVGMDVSGTLFPLTEVHKYSEILPKLSIVSSLDSLLVPGVNLNDYLPIEITRTFFISYNKTGTWDGSNYAEILLRCATQWTDVGT